MEIPFDAIFTLMIFMVVTISSVLQAISPIERQVVQKKGRLDVRSFFRRAIWIVVIGIVAQAIYIWSTHIGDPGANQQIVQQLIWMAVFGFLFYLAWIISQQIPQHYGRREKIVESLTQDILDELKNRRRLNVSGETFNDLANLGKHCEAGQEREIVVKAFMKIAQSVLADSRYGGDSFETFIDELTHMLAFNPEARDLYNYRTTMDIFSSILAADRSTTITDDKRRAVHAISRLGRTLIVNFQSVERDNVILAYINSFDLVLNKPHMLTEISQALYEIGHSAMEAGHDFVAVSALDKLTSLAGRLSPPLPVEFVADLFGLLAHYRAMGGSRREFANRKFEETKAFLDENAIQALKDAQKHLVKTMYFEEADKLGELIEDINPKPKPRQNKN
jgi:hypothetical protein